MICLNIENQLSQLGRAEGGERHGDGDTLLSYLKRTKLKHGAVCLTNFTKTYPPHFFPSGWSAATGRRSFQPTPDFKFLVGISEITFSECGWLVQQLASWHQPPWSVHLIIKLHGRVPVSTRINQMSTKYEPMLMRCRQRLMSIAHRGTDHRVRGSGHRPSSVGILLKTNTRGGPQKGPKVGNLRWFLSALVFVL